MSEGSDPDYRFSLANERTSQAWTRTSLALLGGAVGVARLVPEFGVDWARTTIAALLAVAGLVTDRLAYTHWAGNEWAMRNGRSLPLTPMPALLITVMCLVGVMLLVLVLLAVR
jgi:putative membrane protein